MQQSVGYLDIHVFYVHNFIGVNDTLESTLPLDEDALEIGKFGRKLSRLSKHVILIARPPCAVCILV